MQQAHGIHVVETIMNKQPSLKCQEDITRCIYTRLEAASVGLSEEQAKEAGYDVKVTLISISRECKGVNQRRK